MSEEFSSIDPVDTYVGSRLRLRRNSIGMSQGDLARQLGITFQQVQKYEKGTNRVSASRLHRISQVLDVPVSYFFAGLPGSKSDSDAEGQISSETLVDFLSTADGLRLNKAFVKIGDPAVRRALLILLQAVSQQQDQESREKAAALQDA
ncbi:helix-turn-helix domain-containing protein [Consotaella aegiceratis]|uniref:helix-turn-helix domain-containing protein n=1 Tax=Consotaella aegiceratis TaxID=3097961 RepID=UPI002F3FAE94